MNLYLVASMLVLPMVASCSTTTEEAAAPADQVMCIQDAMQCPDGSWVGDPALIASSSARRPFKLKTNNSYREG